MELLQYPTVFFWAISKYLLNLPRGVTALIIIQWAIIFLR